MSKPSVIFTSTTFLSHGGKLNEAITAFTSLASLLNPVNHVDRVVVVNEYDANEKGYDYAPLIKSRLPSAEFIQKTCDQVGQVTSLNMILEMIGGFDYWLHWEESWRCTHDRFIVEAVSLMEAFPHLTSMQFAEDCFMQLDSRSQIPRVSPLGGCCVEIVPSDELKHLFQALTPETRAYAHRQIFSDTHHLIWPLWGLRPSLHRVNFHVGLGQFDMMPPVLFEWEFAARWFRKGGVKCMSTPLAAERIPMHRSTWAR